MTLDSAEVRQLLALDRASRSRWLLRLQPMLALVADIVVLATASMLASSLRRSWDVFPSEVDVTRTFPYSPLLLVGVWVAVLALRGGYGRHLLDIGPEEYRRVWSGSLMAAGVVGVVCYLFKMAVPRGYVLIAFVIGAPLLLAGRWAAREVMHRLRTWFGQQHQVLIAGHPSSVDEVSVALKRSRLRGYHTLGALVSDEHTDRAETAAGLPILGGLGELNQTVRSLGADVVFLAQGAVSSGAQMRDIAWELESHDVQVVVAPSVTDVSADRVRIRPIGGLPLVHIDRPRGADAVRLGKRTFDVIGSMTLLLMASPLMAFVALRVRQHDGGPALFRQRRTGRDGVEFELLKFRTMVIDAEAKLPDLLAALGCEPALFKMATDPRITKPGRRLRRYSLDELPQLLNVLKGDMSLVGPRPPLPREVEQYDETSRRRLRVRPGLTGLWQVSGRSDVTYEEAIRLDLYYVDNWSMIQDLTILTKTIRAVLGSRGAY